MYFGIVFVGGEHKKWKRLKLVRINRIKQGDIIAFKNNVNEGFQLATEGIRDDNPQKIEQARDMFVKLSEQLPKMSPSKEIMMEDIKSKLLEGYVQVTAEETWLHSRDEKEGLGRVRR